ncbi:MAG: gfo/Idh/MocA family oxidoreductase, partial [Planctomycetia bacterium]|nr:gfo/Idh/MocA family oxidoreductase [Planctomycetia bacterium]
VRSGKIGRVKEVLVGIPKVNYAQKPVPDSAPPPELDYDRWLGPAPRKPYNVNHVHYNFRFFWDYSGGQTTNFGAHHLDIAQWALGMDDSGPVSIDGTAKYNPDHLYEVPMTARITYTYANGVKVILGQEQKDIPQGCTFLGTDGEIFVDRKQIKGKPDAIVKEPLSASDVHLYESKNHHQNFLDCVKSRKRPICDVEVGHRSATVCHLGNIVARLGRGIKWDPSAERIVGDEQAAAMLSRPHRSPYTV